MGQLDNVEKTYGKGEAQNTSAFDGGKILMEQCAPRTAATDALQPRPAASGTDIANNAGNLATESIGKSLWSNSAAETACGRLGAAAAVSELLKASGADVGTQLSVAGLRQKLTSPELGYKQHDFEERKAGDVVMVLGPQRNHVGVVGRDGNVYANSSADGKWRNFSAGSWSGGNNKPFVLRPDGA
jgi:hypothetical protein